ncbi:MAG: 16S rRNA (cytosine(1402)-N(4))-methyltransferase RsmH [Patescibacteria group bacterium]
MHTPVLLEEVMRMANIQPGETIVDGTLDGGGYARASLEVLQGDGVFAGIDWDESMIRTTGKELEKLSSPRLRVIAIHGNFADIPSLIREQGIESADVVVLDLGFSSLQVDRAGRGFSFMRDEPLIMTYSDEMTPVQTLLKQLKEHDLANIFKEIGEERFAKRIAKAIKEYLRKGDIQTTAKLAEIVKGAVPTNYEHGRIHPATRTFMALRIYANQEFENLERILAAVPSILTTGGRMIIVSFHSHEDRIVKQRFREFAKAGMGTLITKKPITPTAHEIASNPRSRSAKLRGLIRT